MKTDNEKTTTQYLWDTVKAVQKKQVYSNTISPQETVNVSNKQPKLTSKTTRERT